MKEDPNKIYWVEEDDMTEPFKAIRADQIFILQISTNLLFHLMNTKRHPDIWALQSLQYRPPSSPSCLSETATSDKERKKSMISADHGFFLSSATAKMHKGPFSYNRRRTEAEKFKKITAFHTFF